MSQTVLVTTPRLAPEGHAVLADAGCHILYVGAQDPRSDLARLLSSERVDGIISRTLPLTADLIASAPSLRAISRHGAGYDNVDIAAAAAHGIPVSVAAGGNAQSVAELALGLMLAVARRIPASDGAIRAGEWPRAEAGLQLSGKTLGLVGYGRIARMLAAMARAIGMEITAYDPASLDTEGATRAASLEILLAEADIVSLHCPLNDASRNLIDAAALDGMKRGALLINTARGGLVDEAALAASLDAGHIAGAGLDALADEPPSPGNPLLCRRDVILTPHIGGTTDTALAATAESAARNLVAMLRGTPIDPALIVNRDLLPNGAFL